MKNLDNLIELYKNLRDFGANYTEEEAEWLLSKLQPFYDVVYRCLRLGIIKYEFYNKFILSPNQLFIRITRNTN